MGCASITENAQIPLEEAPETAPIVDLNASETAPAEATTATADSTVSITGADIETSEQLQQQIQQPQQVEAPAPAAAPIDAWQRLRQGFEITPEKLPYSANKQLQRYLKKPAQSKFIIRALISIFIPCD